MSDLYNMWMGGVAECAQHLRCSLFDRAQGIVASVHGSER